jgi:hypothetical protein
VLRIFGVSAGVGLVASAVVGWIAQNFYTALVIGLVAWLAALMGLLAKTTTQAESRVPLPSRTQPETENEGVPPHGPITHRSVRIADLVDHDNKIRNRMFQLCTIYGPAVVCFLGHTHIISCRVEGDPKGVFFETSGEGRPIGVVWFVDCTLDRCTFVDVGLAGAESAIRHYRKQFNIRG